MLLPPMRSSGQMYPATAAPRDSDLAELAQWPVGPDRNVMQNAHAVVPTADPMFGFGPAVSGWARRRSLLDSSGAHRAYVCADSGIGPRHGV